MLGNIIRVRCILPFFVLLSTAVHSSPIGMELEKTITHRPKSPIAYLKTLRRFSSYLTFMHLEEQKSYIETLCMVYALDLGDKKIALETLAKFKENFGKPRNQKKIDYFCTVLKAKIYSCNDHNIPTAIITLKPLVEELSNGKTISSKDSETMALYGELLTKNGQYYKALKYLQWMAKGKNQLKDKNKAQIFRTIAFTFEKLGKPDSALHYLEQSYLRAIQSKDNKNIGRTAFALGKFHVSSGNPNDAMEYYKVSFQNVNHLEDHAQRMALCNAIGKRYKIDGKIDKVLFFKELELAYSDSLKRNEKFKTAARYLYELHKKKARQLATQAAYERISAQVRWFFTIGLIILLLLFWLGYRNFRKTRKKHHSLHTIAAAIEQIKDSKTASYQEKEKIIDELMLDLKSKSSLQKWDDFEKKFLLSHPDFLLKLQEAHPKLSTNDRKLCICLGENLTTKDISSLTGQNAHAINIARGRLRKKLGIDHHDIPLPEYLHRFI